MTANVPANAFAASGQLDRPRPTSKSQAVQVLETMAKDLDDSIGHRPRGTLGEDANMESALLKFNQTMKENTELRTKIAEMEGWVAAARAETAEARDRGKSLQEQRDLYANYAIEVKTRMETLLVVLDGNAAEADRTIGSALIEVEKFLDARMEQVRTLMEGNAATAKKLITEALEAAKAETIARLQNERR